MKNGIENVESCFFNRFGQLIYKEPRGKLAGYKYPEVGIHRGRLHMILYRAAQVRLGADGVVTDYECTGFEQDEKGITVHFKGSNGEARASVRADAVIACDGINSAIRKQLYPNDAVPRPAISTIFIRSVQAGSSTGLMCVRRLDKYITQDQLRALSENYKKIVGFAVADVAGAKASL